MRAGQIANIDDPRLVRGLAHPLRVRIMAMLEEQDASPVDLAAHLGASLGTVSYHFRRLEELGLIRLVRTVKVRGTQKHIYRAFERPRVSDEAWARTPPATKQAMLGATVQQISEYTATAAAAGGFDRSDAHLTRTALRLDRAGWEQASRACARLLGDLARIEEGVERRQRKARDPEELVDAGVVAMLFEATPFTPARANRAKGGTPPRKRD